MRVPLRWLADYVELPKGTTPARVQEALVRVGLEEEDVHGGDITGPVVVGEVLAFEEEPQKNGKIIRWCQVRVAPAGETAADGGSDVHGIVCGARNFEVGDKVVVTLPGSVLPGPFPIAARKTYGHVSDGMIASSRELGLGDEHDGILRLASLGLDPDVGTDALALLGLDDAAVEVNVTPDRGYALSMRGVAREYSHATRQPFRDPAGAISVQEAEGFSVELTDESPLRGRAGCDLFVTRVVRGIDARRATPPWMVARLRLAGVRPLTLPIDITNYVMLELGQPLHGYDLARLDGGIVVRRARPAETLTTLDGKERSLDPEDLVIADASGAIGLAGVMGGATTEMGDDTADVLLEAAHFDPVSIARTARRHKLGSEASRRFERGVDPEIAAVAAQRAADLLVELAGGRLDPLGGRAGRVPPRRELLLPAGYVSRLIGVDYSPDEVRQALLEIGAAVSGETDGGWRVEVPSWRPDLVDAAGLAEEVARLHGYDRIPALLPVAPPGRGLSRSQRARRRGADALAAAGQVEVQSSPFAGPKQISSSATVEGRTAHPVRLANPLDGERPFLRVSLLPGLVEVAHRNVSRGSTDLAIFEFGTVFHETEETPVVSRQIGTATPPPGRRPSEHELQAIEETLPQQPRHAAGLLVGSLWAKQPGTPAESAGWADGIETVRRLAHAVDAPVRVEQGQHPAFHPGRTAVVVADGADGPRRIGVAGELLPALAREAALPRTVVAWELDLDALIAAGRTEILARPVGTKPAATQDLSVVVAAEVPASEVLNAVAEGAGGLLEQISLVDDYRGTGIEPGRKSLTFSLRFRSSDRTLTAAEASGARDAGLAAAAERFGAELRA